jgi:hypothetical protein
LLLTLSLFVPWVGANHVDAALASHDFAIVANAFNARSNFHDLSPKNGKAIKYSRVPASSTRANPNQISSSFPGIFRRCHEFAA